MFEYELDYKKITAVGEISKRLLILGLRNNKFSYEIFIKYDKKDQDLLEIFAENINKNKMENCGQIYNCLTSIISMEKLSSIKIIKKHETDTLEELEIDRGIIKYKCLTRNGNHQFKIADTSFSLKNNNHIVNKDDFDNYYISDHISKDKNNEARQELTSKDEIDYLEDTVKILKNKYKLGKL